MKLKLAVTLSTILFAITLFSCSHSAENKQAPQNDQIKTDTSKKEVQAALYICPMGKQCGYSDKPGKCSNCGMDLVETK